MNSKTKALTIILGGLHQNVKNYFVNGFEGFPNSWKPHKPVLLTWEFSFQDGASHARLGGTADFTLVAGHPCRGRSFRQSASSSVDGSEDCECLSLPPHWGRGARERREKRKRDHSRFYNLLLVFENIPFHYFLEHLF